MKDAAQPVRSTHSTPQTEIRERRLIYIIGSTVRNWNRGAESRNKKYQNEVEKKAVEALTQLLLRERRLAVEEYKKTQSSYTKYHKKYFETKRKRTSSIEGDKA